MKKTFITVILLLLALNKSVLAHEFEIYWTQPKVLFKLPLIHTVIPGFSIAFETDKPAIIEVTGHLLTRTQACIDFPCDINIGAAFDLLLDGAFMPGSSTGENIDKAQHYYDAQLMGFAEVGPGKHRVTVRGASYTDAISGQGCLALVGWQNYGKLVVKVYPVPHTEEHWTTNKKSAG